MIDHATADQSAHLGGPTVPVAVSIVIPCYRDAPNVAAIYDRCGRVMDEIPNSELILVNDGSPDATWTELVAGAAHFAHPAVLVDLERNFGQHPAVFAGLGAASGQVIVTLDSDLQYPPEEIPRLIAGLSDSTPVCVGYRENRRDPLPRRLITKALTSWISRRAGITLRDYGSMFRAYDRRVVDQLLLVSERRRYIPALVASLGFPASEIAVTHASRGDQGSRYRLGALVDMVLDLVTGDSIFPMRFVTVLGFIAALGGFLATAFFVVYRMAVGAGISGLVTVFSAVFALLAVQLLILALIGEYVGRIYIEAKARPYVTVRRTVRHTS